MARYALNAKDQPTPILSQGACRVHLLIQAFGTGTVFFSDNLGDLANLDSNNNPVGGWSLAGGSNIVIYFQDYGSPLWARASGNASGLFAEVEVIRASGAGAQ